MMVSIGVYVGMCIYKEAYFPVNKNSRKLTLFVFGMGLLNLVIGIMAFVRNGSLLDEDGILLMQSINIIVGVLCILIPIVSYVKIMRDGGSGDDSYSEEE